MNSHEPMNLLTDTWLPVRLKDDSVIKINLTELGRSDIVDIVSPRADFRGAIYQLLIGLLQTTFAPKDRKAWVKYWQKPPNGDELTGAFEPVLTAFVLNARNGEPEFMQDLELSEGKTEGIAALLIDAPGTKTINDNTDLFVKRGESAAMSPWAAALALFTLQINAPSGGSGHRVSLRGGGALTTLVLPPENTHQSAIWHRLWLNMLTEQDIAKLPGDSDLTTPGTTLPWMAPTRTSEKKGMETYPLNAHPLQAYWSMPRRIRLQLSCEKAVCSLTGNSLDISVKSYCTKNYGTNYAGKWVHPLTPYVFDNDEIKAEAKKEPLSVKAQPGGLGYRHWLGLVIDGKQGKITRSPALIVQLYSVRQSWLNDIGEAEFNPRLWAFGYDMDNMKARCWYEAEMPIFNLSVDERDDISEYAETMIRAASDTVTKLRLALKKRLV